MVCVAVLYLQVGHSEQRQQGEGHQVEQSGLSSTVDPGGHCGRQQTWRQIIVNHMRTVRVLYLKVYSKNLKGKIEIRRKTLFGRHITNGTCLQTSFTLKQ